MWRGLQRFACLAAVGLAACNHTPVEGLEKSLSMVVEVRTGEEPAVPIDFLWVIDNSTSMCQEQFSLAKNFEAFTESLERSFDIDPHVAVVSLNCEGDDRTPLARFNTTAARDVSCVEELRVPCGTEATPGCGDLDCEVYGACDVTPAEWTCDAVRTLPEVCTVNPNGSINATCQRTCVDDEDCREIFDDGSFRCRSFGNGGRCVRRPPTEGCPDELPPFLTKDNLDLFRCNASVGVSTSRCLRYEQPLLAGLLALDPNGPNRDQSLSFLRPEAYLVIIFVTDEEDCSVEPGRDIQDERAWVTCGLLPTTDDGGPLTPPAHFVNRFKNLKKDPSKVIVAAIAGDSTRATPEERNLDRAAYLESKAPGSNRPTCHGLTSICASANGVADYAPRIIEVVESFGPNGVFSNICSDEGIGPALDEIANTITRVINRVCLPKPILDGLIVTRTRADGTVETLTEGDGPGHYRIVFGNDDCVSDDGSRPAIALGDPPQPGDVVTIRYEGDPGFY